MRVSARTRYGLRALAAVARSQHLRPVSLRTVAQEEHLPRKYLERLFALLKAAGLVRAVRGAGGGYVLTRLAGEIPLLEIFEVLEGPPDPVECLQPGALCPHEDRCPTRDLWQEVSDAVSAVLAGHTLADLMASEQKCHE
jgi:Rrf2 family protein